jgi:hypothetical protein
LGIGGVGTARCDVKAGVEDPGRQSCGCIAFDQVSVAKKPGLDLLGLIGIDTDCIGRLASCDVATRVLVEDTVNVSEEWQVVIV